MTDAWSGEVDADNGGGVVWCSDFLLAAVEESVGGGVVVFMLLLVSDGEHRHTDRHTCMWSGDVQRKNHKYNKIDDMLEIHTIALQIIVPFDLSSSRPSSHSVRTSKVRKPASLSRDADHIRLQFKVGSKSVLLALLVQCQYRV